MAALVLALGALAATLLVLLAARWTPGAGAPPPPRARAVLTRELYVAGHSRPHPELCPSRGARLQLLVLVTSAPSHVQARAAVRLTWGRYAARSDVTLAFVLGILPSALVKALEAEDELYGDLVVGNFVDSYSNLTLKTLSMLEWADTYCPRAPRLLKTDDDMFINVPRLLAFATAPGRKNAKATIWGDVQRNVRPTRTATSKFYLAPLQFPGLVMPDFTLGGAYLVSGDSVPRLLRAAGALPYIPLEDVFVTGLLAKQLNITRPRAPAFVFYNERVAPDTCAVHRSIAIHHHEQFDLWRKLLDGDTKCAAS